MPPATPRRFPEIVPGISPSALGRQRREAIESLVREAHERRLQGHALRTWLFRVRAAVGSDLAIELLLRLADREPA